MTLGVVKNGPPSRSSLRANLHDPLGTDLRYESRKIVDLEEEHRFIKRRIIFHPFLLEA